MTLSTAAPISLAPNVVGTTVPPAALGVVFAFVVLTLVGRFEALILNTRPVSPPSQTASSED